MTSLPVIYTEKIKQDYQATLKRLEPISKEVGWKGRIVYSFTSKCKQILELFKTFHWSVEEQIRVKIQGDFDSVAKLTREWCIKNQTENTKAKALTLDYLMGMQLNARLSHMEKIIDKALVNKRENKELLKLARGLYTEIQNNIELLKLNSAKLNYINQVKVAFFDAEIKAKEDKYNDYADVLIAKNSKHIQWKNQYQSGNDLFAKAKVNKVMKEGEKAKRFAMINNQSWQNAKELNNEYNYELFDDSINDDDNEFFRIAEEKGGMGKEVFYDRRTGNSMTIYSEN